MGCCFKGDKTVDSGRVVAVEVRLLLIFVVRCTCSSWSSGGTSTWVRAALLLRE